MFISTLSLFPYFAQHEVTQPLEGGHHQHEKCLCSVDIGHFCSRSKMSQLFQLVLVMSQVLTRMRKHNDTNNNINIGLPVLHKITAAPDCSSDCLCVPVVKTSAPSLSLEGL